MQVALLIATLLIGNQSPVARFGFCTVHVQAGAGVKAGVASVKLRGKTVWARKCDSELVATYGDPASGHFLVLTPPTGLAVFRPDGNVLKQVAFPADGDPRPFLHGGPIVVWGENVFNWIKLDKDSLQWQNETRRFFAVDLRNGHTRRLPCYRDLGLPLAVNGSDLISVVPVDWKAALARGRARRFWIQAIHLRTGACRRAALRLSERVGKALFLDIIGWDSWKETASTFDARSGLLTVTSSQDGRRALTIKVPNLIRSSRNPCGVFP